MAYDQLKYRTLLVAPFASAPSRLKRAHPDHGVSAVESPQSPFGHPLHLDGLSGEEDLNCYNNVGVVQVSQLDPPTAGGQPVGKRTTRCNDHVDDVESGWKGGVQGGAHVVGVAPLAEPDLEVLGLARRPGG